MLCPLCLDYIPWLTGYSNGRLALKGKSLSLKWSQWNGPLINCLVNLKLESEALSSCKTPCAQDWSWTQKYTCLCLPSAAIKYICHHAQLQIVF